MMQADEVNRTVEVVGDGLFRLNFKGKETFQKVKQNRKSRNCNRITTFLDKIAFLNRAKNAWVKAVKKKEEPFYLMHKFQSGES